MLVHHTHVDNCISEVKMLIEVGEYTSDSCIIEREEGKVLYVSGKRCSHVKKE